MAYHRKKLFVLIIVQVLLVVLHKSLASEAQDSFGEWHYLIAMGFFVYLCSYILLLKCPNPNCRAPQIYRGVNPNSWALPNETCWKCGTKID